MKQSVARRVTASLAALLVALGVTLGVTPVSAAAAPDPSTCSRTRNIPDQSGYIDFYHGTSAASAAAIHSGGIDPSRGDPDTDFGSGFYITTMKTQAQEWARKRYGDQTPVTMHYRVKYTDLDKPVLCGKVFPSADTDWQNFVRKMRSNPTTSIGGDGYDFVEGPLLFKPEQWLNGGALVTGGQQDSIHTAAAAAIFNADWVDNAAVSPAKVMIVGDSISQGSAGDYTWRYRFDKHEKANGALYDLVGPRTDLFDNVAGTWNDNHTYADPNFNQHHDAIWGRTLADAAANIQDEMTANQPDYLLVLLGINDLSWGTSDAAGTEDSLKHFIANARTANPYVRMVFGTLLPNSRTVTDSAYASMVADYNRRLTLDKVSLNTGDSPIALATPGADIVPSADLWDGTHPNAAGEVKIAAAFADALANGFGDTTHGPGFGVPYPRPYPPVPLGPRTAPQLTATAGDGQAALTWTTSPGATGYYVYQRNVTAGETGFTKLPYPLPGSSWTAQLLANGSTYQYQLGTTKGNTEGVKSNVVTVTPKGVVPGATTLSVQAANNAADLSWTAVPHTTGQYVFVKNITAGETSFTQLPYPVSGTSWTAAGLVAGAQYQFQLQSVNGATLGGKSNIASVTIDGSSPAATTLSGTAGNGSITLTWTAVSGASGYYVYQKNISGGETRYTQLPYPVSGTNWTATGLVPGGQYAYRLQSLNGSLRGGTSNAVTLTTGGTTPGTPTLSGSPGNGSVTLSWGALANASGYYVYRRDISGGESGYTQLPYPVSGTSWTATGLVPGGQYAFKIQSLNGLIKGGTSNAVTVTAGGSSPGAPSLSVSSGNQKATLSWSAVSNASGYFVYRKDTSSGETTYTQLPYAVTGTSWIATGLIAGGQYSFKLQAINGYIRGGTSSAVGVTVGGDIPDGPTNLKAAAGHNAVTLTWKKAAGATGYYVWMRDVTGGEANFSRLPFPVEGSSWEATLLINNHQYQFKLQSLNQLLFGGYSNVATATPTPAPIPPATRYTSATSGWLNSSMEDPTAHIALNNIFGSFRASRSDSTMTLVRHWDSGGKQIYDGLFKYQLWDCSVPSGNNPLGTLVWSDDFAYPTGTNATSGDRTSSTSINPTHYYAARLLGGGHYAYNSDLQASFDVYTPPSSTPLNPFEAHTACF